MTLTAAGGVDDFGEADITTMKESVAAELEGVDASDVTVTIEEFEEGLVRITIDVETPDDSTSSETLQALEAGFGDPQEASDQLGVQVESTPEFSVADADSGGGGALGGQGA